jgi:hypothetical protein
MIKRLISLMVLFFLIMITISCSEPSSVSSSERQYSDISSDQLFELFFNPSISQSQQDTNWKKYAGTWVKIHGDLLEYVSNDSIVVSHAYNGTSDGFIAVVNFNHSWHDQLYQLDQLMTNQNKHIHIYYGAKLDENISGKLYNRKLIKLGLSFSDGEILDKLVE